MSANYGLTPPWDTEHEALNAAEILDETKRGTGKYLEHRGEAVWCEGDHKGQPGRVFLLRVFSGPDEDGTRRKWLLVPRYNEGRRRVPALCRAAPTPDKPYWHALYGHCRRCGAGVVVLRPDEEVSGYRLTAKARDLRLTHGPSSARPLQVGDPASTIRVGKRWADGPAGLWITYADPPIYRPADTGRVGGPAGSDVR